MDKNIKCAKCGMMNLNTSDLCEFCGEKLLKESAVNFKSSNNSGKKKSKIWIFLIILLVLIIGLVIFLFVKKDKVSFVDPFSELDKVAINSKKGYDDVKGLLKLLEEDYKNGELTSDEYIMQLCYYIYEPSKLNSKYVGYDKGGIYHSYLVDKVSEFGSELSNETLLYVGGKIFLSDVEWNVDEEGNKKLSNDNNDSKVSPLGLFSDADLSRLDEVILSRDENFLIYYTNDGKNAITDEYANNIANYLEDVVVRYNGLYGLDFKYEAVMAETWLGEYVNLHPLFPKAKITSLLRKKGIDKSYMKTAMPVFIIDTDVNNTGALGYYASSTSKLLDVLKLYLRAYNVIFGLGTKEMILMSCYSVPFFVVSSVLNSFDDAKIVLAHELFHHYQKYICGDGEYEKCKSGLFTEETTANTSAMVGSQLNDINLKLNGYAGKIYMNETANSIDKVGVDYDGESAIGYGAFVFAYNYINIVDDGQRHMFNSMKHENALKYLYDSSNGKYKEVMLTLSKKNLTMDYENKLLLPVYGDVTYYPKNYLEIENYSKKYEERSNYSSIQYYYIDPIKYQMDTQLKFHSVNDDLSLVFFVYENGVYKSLYEHDLDKEFVIDISDFSAYDEIVISIVNSSYEGIINYNFEVIEDGDEDVTISIDSLGLNSVDDIPSGPLQVHCYRISEDDDFKNTIQVLIDFKDDYEITDAHLKATMELRNMEDKFTFKITQALASYIIKKTAKEYEDNMKYVDIMTKKSESKYDITMRVTNNYYEALAGEFGLNENNKYELVKSIRSEGFTCSYR